MAERSLAKYLGGELGPVVQGAMSTVTTAGPVTLTPAQFVNGAWIRDPNGAGRSDTTPTAWDVIKSLPNPKIDERFEFFVRNTADAAETITLVGGTGVTITGTATIAQNATCLFYGYIKGVTQATAAITLLRGPGGVV